MTPLATNLKSIRKELRMSQRAVAEAVGTNQRNIDAYENRGIEPRLEILLRLSQLFNVSIHELISSEDFTAKEQTVYSKYNSSPQHIKKAINILLKL